MKKLVVLAMVVLFGCAGWQVKPSTADRVKTVAALTRGLTDMGAGAACLLIEPSKKEKCWEVQAKILAATKMAVFLANKAVDLLAKGDAVTASAYVDAALEAMDEAYALLRSLEVLK